MTVSIDSEDLKVGVDSSAYLVVSTDSHASPSLEKQLRPYCPARYLTDFDEFVTDFRKAQAHSADAVEPAESAADVDSAALRFSSSNSKSMGSTAKRAEEESLMCAGLTDPHERIRDMDRDGVAADVIISGAPNGEVLPFLALGFDQGPQSMSVDLRSVGSHIWNQWLADFVSVQPERHVGVMQIAILDVERAAKEVEFGRNAGLGAVNLPAPRHDYPPYTDPIYEPLWSACEDNNLPLLTHCGGGEFPLGADGPNGFHVYMCETEWLGRRGLWQLIFGGVFERHPGLKIVFTEQRTSWVPETLRNLDSIYYNDLFPDIRDSLPKPPSEYWESNCALAGSFLARFEAEMLDEIGQKNLMWGSDYPHVEGTWPCTRQAMRNTFATIPQDRVRRILGENALSIYGLDAQALRTVADRIGPTPQELSEPLSPEEFPEIRGFAFRERGSFS